ncbi:hypothetical protein BQ8420_03475 [Nocardiopsis sp. JB363]|nr:hypothetical protein BQ8420_03475 [Nocardiopsis sp. JB363]
MRPVVLSSPLADPSCENVGEFLSGADSRSGIPRFAAGCV